MYTANTKSPKPGKMGLFNKNPELPREVQKPTDILEALKSCFVFQAEEFSKKFPVGTLVKTWSKGEEEYNTTFGYVCGTPSVHWNNSLLSPMNIEIYKEYNSDKNNSSFVFWPMIPIVFNQIEVDKEHRMFGPQTFGICASRFVEQTTIEEYKEYMLSKFKKRIEQSKQEIKQRRAWIIQDKKRLHHFDDKISKALSITAENYDKEMKKNCIDTKH